MHPRALRTRWPLPAFCRSPSDSLLGVCGRHSVLIIYSIPLPGHESLSAHTLLFSLFHGYTFVHCHLQAEEDCLIFLTLELLTRCTRFKTKTHTRENPRRAIKTSENHGVRGGELETSLTRPASSGLSRHRAATASCPTERFWGEPAGP